MNMSDPVALFLSDPRLQAWQCWLAVALAAICGYLIGSVNFAVLVSRRRHGTDVRTMGSGNAGMTNMLRNFGKLSAALTMAGDTCKGIAAVFLGRALMLLLVPGVTGLFGLTLYGAYAAGIATILGHAFPLFFGFKGGKGIATSLGVILALQPAVALALLAIFLIVLALSKMVSLGSVVGIAFYPLFTFIWAIYNLSYDPIFETICAAVVAAIVIWLHRANIRRIAAGTEYKFGQKRADTPCDAAPEKENG